MRKPKRTMRKSLRGGSGANNTGNAAGFLKKLEDIVSMINELDIKVTEVKNIVNESKAVESTAGPPDEELYGK